VFLSKQFSPGSSLSEEKREKEKEKEKKKKKNREKVRYNLVTSFGELLQVGLLGINSFILSLCQF
jgi:hypothetical protein